MLQRMLATTAALALFALPLAAQSAGPDMTLTGHVIDINCHTTQGAAGTGAAHKACATACATKGVALAILGSDGQVYMVVSRKPANPQNPRLMPFVEQNVKVTGWHRMVDGLHTIEIETIEAAS